MPLYAECGGLMYLTRIQSTTEKNIRMVGLIDADTKMTKKMTLNYTKGTVCKVCVLSEGSNKLRWTRVPLFRSKFCAKGRF